MLKFEKVVENIYLLRTPFSTLWTGVTLLTGEKNFLIDSGAEEPEAYILPALREMGMEIHDIDYLLNTHCHGDHIGGHHSLVSRHGLRVATIDVGVEPLRDPAANAVRIRTKFPADSPAPQSWLKGVLADVVLRDGEVLENRLKVFSTPGHDRDCVCFYDIPTKTVISGDSIQGNGTPTQGIGFYQSLQDYTDSIERLKREEIDNILCGHEYDGIGDVISGRGNVRKALSYCSDRVQVYEEEVRSCLARGMTGEREIAAELIRKIGCGMPDRLFLAMYTVQEHIKHIKEKEQ